MKSVLNYGSFCFYNLTVYWNLKPLFIMAKFELKFKDSEREGTEISTKVFDQKEIEIRVHVPNMATSYIYLDKSTAIKFAKTLRTEINKITESEVLNG